MEEKGDLLIWDLWQKGANSIHGMHVMNNEMYLYVQRDPMKFLQVLEKEKKQKYLEVLPQQRRHLSPFVCSVDDILGAEADVVLKCLVILLSTN